VLSPSSDSPVASGLHAESVINEADVERTPATSINPAMTYALLALIGCILNFALLIGAAVYCARDRRRHDLDYDSMVYGVTGDVHLTSAIREDQRR
jgi:hypothetical protein